ncbi:hypothetical protein LBHB_09865 [Leptospira borgpetersenii serovar Hardjo]|nr:hypothetical protein LBHB_09865 [Leptospira borgpetersenii serovar Hardjo]
MIMLISFQVLGQVFNQFCRFPQNSIKKLSPIIQEPNLRKSYRIPTKLLVPQRHIRQNGAPSGLEKRGLDASIYHKTRKPTEGTQ